VWRFPGQFLRRTELIKRSLRLDDEPKWWCREPPHYPHGGKHDGSAHVGRACGARRPGATPRPTGAASGPRWGRPKRPGPTGSLEPPRGQHGPTQRPPSPYPRLGCGGRHLHPSHMGGGDPPEPPRGPRSPHHPTSWRNGGPVGVPLATEAAWVPPAAR